MIIKKLILPGLILANVYAKGNDNERSDFDIHKELD